MTTASPVIDLATRSQAHRPARARTAVLASGVIFAAVWTISLSRSLFDPIGFDQALYQYITDRVMLGERLYTDVWDQNTPAIVGIHWLATTLVGRTPIALRVFDAGWQALTLLALVLLAVRSERRWQAGWLAATLYALAYYGLGYVHTAQREGFAVLPLLLAVHAVLRAPALSARVLTIAGRYAIAGLMGFIVFAIKPPLGLCFGVLWLMTVFEAWRHRSAGRQAWTATIALTIGFLVAAGLSVVALVHLGWWNGFCRVMTRKDVSGYILGPQMIRELLPCLAAGTAVIIAAVAILPRRWSKPRPELLQAVLEYARWAAVGLGIFALILTLQSWSAWQQTFLRLAGLLLPAFGAVILSAWSQRSRTWRITVMLAAASLTAIVWQGHFALYQYPPLLACVAYLTAVELDDRLGRFREAGHAGRTWTIACLAGVIHLTVSTWGWTMTHYGTSPYVLAGTSLADHYTKITRNKPSFPTYDTTVRAAARIRELTTENEPIACLLDEPRIYLFAERPAAYPLLRTQACYSSFFTAMIETIHTKRPKVVVARLPAELRNSADVTAASTAVFADLESRFGPLAILIRQDYHLAEIINGDVCILRPEWTP